MSWKSVYRRKDQQPHLTVAAIDALRAIEFRVRPDFRKTVVFGLIAFAALIAGHDIGGVHASSLRTRLASYGCLAVLAIFGFAASRTGAREVQRVATARAGTAAATPLRLTILLIGYLFTALCLCDLGGIDVRQFLVGGAITGIVVGLAAQPVLSNLFAGLVLMFARPYVPGEKVRVLSGSINGPHDGVVISAGILYTVLETASGPLNIPNSTLLAAAVGPAPEEPKPDAATWVEDEPDDGVIEYTTDAAPAAQRDRPVPSQAGHVEAQPAGYAAPGPDVANAAAVIADAEAGSIKPSRNTD